MNNAVHGQIRELLTHAHRILVVSHVRPDGDAVGSLLGLGLALQAADKQVQMVLADGVPRNFRYLPGSNQVERRASGEFDCTAILDCSDLERTGGVLADRPADLCIDHHITNLNFAKINCVYPAAVSTSSILAEHLDDWGLPITQPVAAALLTGIISDTLGFRTSNMTPDALRQAATLMELGADLPKLYNLALVGRSFESIRYWGQGMQRIQREGSLVWTALTLEDRKMATYPGNDDADLVNLLSTIDDSDIVVMFVEQNGNRVKVSWRARPGWDVSKIALQFGGGGHPAAAGAEISGNLAEVQEQVLQVTRAALNSSPKNHHATRLSAAE